MRTKAAAYFLVLLLAWAQTDDVWSAPAWEDSDPSLADPAEEYLPARVVQHREQCAEDQAPPPLWVRAEIGGAFSPLLPRGPAAEARTSAPFGPPPLYVLMSLQR